MKVNMTPNPLDVVTIHASQGDTEARQWEFELHNNGELIDTSDVKEQLVFKSYKGGTEQLLPENGSTPTTSPFLGDIRYPQGLLTDQEFTYRQSPTEEDGLAKITDIKGNTLVWNQLVQNGNFVDTSLWRTYASTGFSVSNNVGSFTVTGASGAIYQTNTPTYVNGHKYLVIADFYVSQQSNINVEVSGTRGKTETVNANTWYRYSDTVTPSAQGNLSLTCGQASVQVRNVMCFDLTQMGLDITDPSEFTSLFSLSYYSYNQGSLLSFNGNGIKTVGFNQWDEQWEVGAISDTTGQNTTSTNRIRSKNYIKVIPSQTYYLCMPQYGLWVYWYDANYNYLGRRNPRYAGNTFEIIEEGCNYIRFEVFSEYGTTYKNNICINISNTELNGTYKPYTSSTLSLPISTYFPTGMKSAGTVYDELTESKAITRIGSVDLGTLSWNWQSTWQAWYTYQISTSLKGASNNDAKPNIVSANYPTLALNSILGTSTFGISISNVSSGNKLIAVENGSDTVTPTGYLYYELATPTETSFTTASLVTENAEIPLSNNDGVLVGKCTEELSENPGFIDAKIKLADADGECYSNKLQLHVERSPQ